MSSNDEFSRGVLYAKKSQTNYQLQRLRPSDPVAAFVETFWLVEWDLPLDQPHLQQNIPDPCIHMVFEAGKSRIVGAVTKRYSVELSTKGEIFGLKFRPGGFFALMGLPAWELTDTTMKMADVGCLNAQIPMPHNITDNVLNADSIDAKAKLCDAFLRPRIDQLYSGNVAFNNIERINEIVNLVNDDSSIAQVEHLSDRTNLSIRTLQRLFKSEVGVSPKWLIRKYRIQEVLSRLENGQHDWQDMISNMGYFDQAHFIRDFQELIGVTPTQYLTGLTSAKSKAP